MKASVPLIFLLTLAGGFLFPWWWPALAAYAAYAAAYFFPGRARSGGKAFLSGFAGAGSAWLLLAAFMDWRNGQILSTRVAGLFHLPYGWMLPIISGLVGGLLGGFGAWAGQALCRWLSSRRQAGVSEASPPPT